MWTKDGIKTVLTMWNSSTKQQIADRLGCSVTSVGIMAFYLRKEGADLPKKTIHGEIRKLVRDVLAEVPKAI